MSDWAPLQIPGGSYDGGWVAPLASSYPQAAEMSVRPLTRMLEQVLASRLNERAQTQQIQFMSQQQERDIAARAALQEQAREDQFAHEMLMAQQKRQQEIEAAQAMSGALYGGGGGYDPTSRPGTGPLSFEGVMGAQGMSGMQPPTPQQTAALGPQGVSAVYNNQQQDRTNARLVASEEAKAAADAAQAQALAQAADSWRKSLIADESLAAEDARRIYNRSLVDQKGAAEEYEAVLREQREALAKKAEETAKKTEQKERGIIERRVPMVGLVEFPEAIERLPKEGVTSMAAMPIPARDALWQVARAQVGQDLMGRGEITQAAAQGLLDPKSPLAGVYAQEIRLRANEIASTFGWTREPGFESGRAPGAQEQAPAQQAQSTEAPAPELPKRLIGVSIESVGAPETQALIREARKSGLFNKNPAEELREFFSRTPEEREVFLATGKYPPKRMTEEQQNARKRDFIQMMQGGQR